MAAYNPLRPAPAPCMPLSSTILVPFSVLASSWRELARDAVYSDERDKKKNIIKEIAEISASGKINGIRMRLDGGIRD